MDKNQNDDDGVILEFDVMHDQEPSGKSRIMKRPAIPPSQPTAQSQMDHETSSGHMMSDMMHSLSGIFSPRVVYVIVVVIVLGVGGYFGYRWYMNRPEPVDTQEQPTQDETPKLPSAWLEENFLTNICSQEEVCGVDADPDRDGLTNMKEYESLTNPNLADTDFDGLADIDEIQIFSTDPIVVDSDGDGFEDGQELRNGYSPNVASTQPASALELQVFSENTSKYGMQEGTTLFLAMQNYTTNLGIEGIPSLTLSKPKSWTANQEGDVVTLSDPTSLATIKIRAIPTDTPTLSYVTTAYAELQDGGQVQFLSSSEFSVRGSVHYVSEYTYSDPENALSKIRDRRVFVGGQGVVYDITMTNPDTVWASARPTYNVSTFSSRVK